MPTTTHHIATLPLQNGPWIFVIIGLLMVACILCFVGYQHYWQSSSDHLPSECEFFGDVMRLETHPGYCQTHAFAIIGSHTAETRLYDQDAVDA